MGIVAGIDGIFTDLDLAVAAGGDGTQTNPIAAMWESIQKSFRFGEGEGGFLQKLIGSIGNGGVIDQLLVLGVRWVVQEVGCDDDDENCAFAEDSLLSLAIGQFTQLLTTYIANNSTSELKAKLTEDVNKEEGLTDAERDEKIESGITNIDDARRAQRNGMFLQSALSMGIAALLDNIESGVEGDRAGINQMSRLKLLGIRAVSFVSGAIVSSFVAVVFDDKEDLTGRENEDISLNDNGEPIHENGDPVNIAVDSEGNADDHIGGGLMKFFGLIWDDLREPFENLGIHGVLAAASARNEDGNLVGLDGKVLSEAEAFQEFYDLIDEMGEMNGRTPQRTVNMARANQRIRNQMRAANARLDDDDPGKLTEEELESNITNRIALNVANTMDAAGHFLTVYSLDIMNSRLGSMMITPDQSPFFATVEFTLTGLLSEDAKNYMKNTLGLNLRYLARDELGDYNNIISMVESRDTSRENAIAIAKGEMKSTRRVGDLIGKGLKGRGYFTDQGGRVTFRYLSYIKNKKIFLS